MLRAMAAFAGLWLLAGSALAQEQADIPAPERIDNAAVQAWLEHHIQADGWNLLGADSAAVALLSPEGVRVTQEGVLLVTVRHEYYAPRAIDGHTMRSVQQIRMLDCEQHTNRVISMTIFERSNLQGAAVRREMPNAEWTTPGPNSLYQIAMDRICAVPREAAPQN